MPVSPPPKRASYDETSSVNTAIVTRPSSANGSPANVRDDPRSAEQQRQERDADRRLVEVRSRLLECLPRQRPAIGCDRVAPEHARAGHGRDDDGADRGDREHAVTTPLVQQGGNDEHEPERDQLRPREHRRGKRSERDQVPLRRRPCHGSQQREHRPEKDGVGERLGHQERGEDVPGQRDRDHGDEERPAS